VSESKHTPGPWGRLCMHRDGCKCGYIANDGGAVIAQALFNDPSIPDKRYERLEETITIEEADANMNLIAAAPQMLEALKDVFGVPGIVDCMPVSIWDKIEYAIQKAENELD
jgi:hypothetical protein